MPNPFEQLKPREEKEPETIEEVERRIAEIDKEIARCDKNMEYCEGRGEKEQAREWDAKINELRVKKKKYLSLLQKRADLKEKAA